MPTSLRIFVEFAGHFLPILGDSGVYHVFPIPANCSTVNDLSYEIIKKYELQSLAPGGVQLKINNKYVLLASDYIKNSIREGDELHISPRIIQSKWNNNTSPNKQSSKKRKKAPNQNENENNGEIIRTPLLKKRKISHIDTDISAAISVISNATSASSSVTCYSSSDSDENNLHNHNKLDNFAHELDNKFDINNNNDRNSSSSDDDDGDSTDTSQDNQENDDCINIKESSTESESDSDDMDNKQLISTVNDIDDKQSVTESESDDIDDKQLISTVNDAIKAVQDRKQTINKKSKENEGSTAGYMRSVNVNDRIKIYIDDEWECGTVKAIGNDNMVQLLMDDSNDLIRIYLDVMEWDFEPQNFAAPRVLKKINKKQYNEEEEGEDGEEEIIIKRLIEESGNHKIANKGLKCDEMIGYKTLELVNWEPMHSKFKMGKVIEIENDIVIIENNGNQKAVTISNLVEIYEIKVNEFADENGKKLKQIKEKRKKRKLKQRQKKAIGKSKSE